jgi:hypothetical protein
MQKSEFHSFSGDDSYYLDYFLLTSPAQAAEYNRLYQGMDLELAHKGPRIWRNDDKWQWANPTKGDSK